MQIDAIPPVTNVAPTGSRVGLSSNQTVSTQSAGSGNLAASARNTADETSRALEELQQNIEPFNVSLKFSRDEDTGTIVIQMIDKQTGDTLQQIPDQASLHLAATLRKLQGKLFSCKV